MRSIKKTQLLAVVAAFVLLLSGGGSWLMSKHFWASSDERAERMGSMELSKEEYEQLKLEFLQLEDEQNPKIALAELRARIKTDDALLRSCHALVHEMGRAAYEKYHDFAHAMEYQDEVCNSGYLHGVIEGYFSKSADVFSAMQTVCNGYPPGKFVSRECYHGIGHGVMYYTSNDLPRSLLLCDSFESTFARAACSNGVFMENFNTDQKLHPSVFLKESDPLYPCGEQAIQHKNDCYFYALTYYLSLYRNEYVGALGWCNSAESPYQEICAQGVGSQVMKENINNPKLAEKMCMQGKPSQAASCVFGMVELYIHHYGFLEPAKKLCNELEINNRQTCHSSVEESSKLFN